MSLALDPSVKHTTITTLPVTPPPRGITLAEKPRRVGFYLYQEPAGMSSLDHPGERPGC